ncbi:MAG: AAA family ATPase [Polyangiales bacterium]
MPPGEDRLRALYMACDPMEPLGPGDPRWVDFDRAVGTEGETPRSDRSVEFIRRRMRFGDQAPQPLLLSGLRGSGKTTELQRLVALLEEDGHLAVRVDLDNYIDMAGPLDPADVLVAVSYEAERAVLTAEARDPDVAGAQGFMQRLLQWMATTEVTLAGEPSLSISPKVMLGAGPRLSKEFQTRTLLRDKVRSAIEDHRAAFLQQVRDALFGLSQRAVALGRLGLVAVVDSLDHLWGGGHERRAVIDSVERFFRSSFVELPIPTLFTIPPDLALRQMLLPLVRLPLVRLRSVDGARHAPGYDALRELIERRIPLAELALLFGEGRVDVSIEALTAASGGSPRALVSLLRDVLLECNGDDRPISEVALRRTIHRRGDAVRQSAHFEGDRAIDLLARVQQTATLRAENEGERDLIARLISVGAVHFYADSEEWWDVHPAVRDMPEVQEAARNIPHRRPHINTTAADYDPATFAISLRSLRLSNLRLFDDEPIDFTHDGAPRPFTLVVAENGHGKTTLLQAIALAASGTAGANLLAENAAAFFDRRKAPNGHGPDAPTLECGIAAGFDVARKPGDTSDQTLTLRASLHAPAQWKEFLGENELVVPGGHFEGMLDAARAQDLPCWFVAGYGVGRMLPRARVQREPGRRAVDRVRSLFSAEPPLATGFADALADLFGREAARDYAAALFQALVGDGRRPGILPADASLHIEAIELRGAAVARNSPELADADRFVLRLGDERLELPAGWLSAGYQSTIAWVADVIGQFALEAGRVVPPEQMAGLVLIDEIDLHLHPRWQAGLVPALRAVFPRMQFVATTHSPMVLPGLKQHEIVMLALDETGHLRHRPAPVAPALKTGSEIYDHFFGIHGLYPSELGSAFQEYSFLASNPDRDDAEEARMQALRTKLREADVDPGWEPEPRTASGDAP